MTPRQPKDMHTDPDLQLGEEAAEWFLRMRSGTPEPDETYPDPKECLAAFKAWLEQSPEHQHAYRQIEQLHQAAFQLTPPASFNVQALLQQSAAEVIPLPTAALPQHVRTKAPATTAIASRWVPRVAWGASALAAAVIASVLVSYTRAKSEEFVTAVGEQRTAKLDDGSILQLNTDTKISVTYSKAYRRIHLIQGEALFSVEHDPTRPFIVEAENAHVRAVGTEFNVRNRTGAVDVTVVEGVVQVSASDSVTGHPIPNDSGSNTATSSGIPAEAGSATQIRAGELAHVTSGRIIASKSPSVSNALAWRQRRLPFENATLGQVAEEFNRYNRVKIRVLGDAARIPMFTSANFAADHPESVILYASKHDSLVVEADGQNWIIHER
jgi:transmembrane sensor